MRLRSGRFINSQMTSSSENFPQEPPSLGGQLAASDWFDHPWAPGTRTEAGESSAVGSVVAPANAAGPTQRVGTNLPTHRHQDRPVFNWAPQVIAACQFLMQWSIQAGLPEIEQRRRDEVYKILLPAVQRIRPTSETTSWTEVVRSAIVWMHADLLQENIAEHERTRRIHLFLNCLTVTSVMEDVRQTISSSSPPKLTNAVLHAWLMERDISPVERLQRTQVFLRIIAKSESFYEPIVVAGDLELSNHTSITSLPAGLAVIGSLSLTNLANLVNLPPGFYVADSLTISDCPYLTSLPEKLNIGGHLHVSGCTSLTELPAALSVGQDLSVTDCTSLTHLPPNLDVGANLDLHGCTSLTNLPAGIETWGLALDDEVREVNLCATGIAAQTRAQIEQLHAPGMMFFFDEEQQTSSAAGYVDLSAAMTGWFDKHDQLTQSSNLRPEEWPMSTQARHDLCEFLTRLTDTREYKNETTQPSLVERTYHLLTQMEQSEALREICNERIAESLHSCDDRVIQLMNQLELAVRVHQAQHEQLGQGALETLGIGLMKLEVVHHHAAATCHRLSVQGQDPDDLEVYLMYETRLRRELDLPLSTTHMVFNGDVQEAELRAAADAATLVASNPVQQRSFFAQWEPWQKFTRQQKLQMFDFDTLPVQALPVGDNDEPMCLITHETLRNLESPVAIGAVSHARVYEREAFIQWWKEHGKEPNPAPQTPVKLTDLWRPRW